MSVSLGSLPLPTLTVAGRWGWGRNEVVGNTLPPKRCERNWKFRGPGLVRVVGGDTVLGSRGAIRAAGWGRGRELLQGRGTGMQGCAVKSLSHGT